MTRPTSRASGVDRTSAPGTRTRRVTHKDVAERAGVSVATVSYVLNGGPRPVSPETRARVQAVIDELEYYPNDVARSLRRRQSRAVGLLIPSITNTFYAEVAHALETSCHREGFVVLLCNSEGEAGREERYVQALRAGRVDGLVVIAHSDPAALLRPILQARLPVVLLEHDVPGVACVAIEEFRGGQVGTEHLLGLGHRRVALLRETPTSALSRERVGGYRAALSQAGIDYDPALVVECGATLAEGHRVTSGLLALPDPPTAVFAHNDLLALGACHAVHQAGLRVPQDVSVVGYDDVASAAYLNPPLTTMRFPKAEMGRRAGELILGALRGEELPARTVTLPVELVVRASTAPPRAKGTSSR
ncbi:LacI family DNA-binding transcriptional regulator [Deinococcus planocerae]|uniref:LacI family DNA-binding transcriptional regulator n=1 Tax=Deinococcus planocerae TaxID=1737569 RepID=UPI0015E103F5|nr:LacI family DNA-binding transcriptional regulator [Deinococcus planocerae]